MIPCFGFGSELKITELIAGYTGASNNPIKGKIYAATGAFNQPVIFFPDSVFASGIATIIRSAASNNVPIKTYNQFNFFKTSPAKNLPNAVEPARILPI